MSNVAWPISRLALVLVGASLLGCAGSIDDLDVQFESTCIECHHAGCDRPLDIQYLGSGGFLIARGADAIATGPFFSNPSVWRTGLAPLSSDADLVAKFMPTGTQLDAILVGHGHYDHLMDVPNVVARLRAVALADEVSPKNSTIYASRSAIHSVASIRPPLATQSLRDFGWKPGSPMRWIQIPGTRIHLLAIESEHAPHFLGMTFMGGRYSEDQESLPRRNGDWLEGQTYSFLIELRDERGHPEFRIHFQDSASSAGVGMPPAELDSDSRIAPYTILLPTVASWSQVEGYPEALLDRLNPDYAILGHWEDFFRPLTRDPDRLKTVRLTNVKRFLEEVEHSLGKAAYALPAPLTKFRFARECAAVTN